MIITEIIKNVVLAGLSLIMLAMTLRSILSWVMPEENNFTLFLYNVTEPFIYPMRYLLHKLNVFQKTGIDMAFLLTFVILFITVNVLPS